MEGKESKNLSGITGIKKIACLIPLLIVLHTSLSQSKIYAKRGVLDLRNWNWETNGIAELNGEWEFYWRSLYTPASFDSANIAPSTYSNIPGFWNSLIPGISLFDAGTGYATYRLKILCPPSKEKLGLKFLTVGSAYKLFVNGEEALQVGKVGTAKETSETDYRPVIVHIAPVNGELNLVIQVSNYDYTAGGLWDFIKLGTEEQVENYRIKNVAIDFFIAGGFFLMFVFYFVIYIFFRRRLSPLYFCIFCLLLAVRPLVTDELAIMYFTNWSWHFIKHLEFLSVYLAVPVFSLFSFELFPNEFSKRVLTAILIVSSPFVLIAIFASPFIFRYCLRPFEIFMMLTACYGLLVYIRALRNKRPGSGFFLAGFILLFITFVNDLLYTSLIIETIPLVYMGLFIFIVLQGVALSKQFLWTFSRLEILNKTLEQINAELSLKNNTIIETNEQLTKLNAELDSLVYRTSHDLRSPVTSIMTLVEIIKNEEDPAKRDEYLNLQTKTLYRLDSLITDTLDFAINKRIELKYEYVDFTEFINSAIQAHIYSDNSESIKRFVEIQQQATFITDKTRLNIVINNLISNALRYHNKNQDHPYLKISVNADVKMAELLVEDNGQGIEEKHLDHIFTMFYRANKTIGGSGIGLYIVKEAIEKLGGTIKIESRINVGTKFTIVIPNFAGSQFQPGQVEQNERL